MLVSVDKTHKGTYGHIHCLTCGIPWGEHTAACSRHAYIPAEFRQAEIDTGSRWSGHRREYRWAGAGLYRGGSRYGDAETARAAR